MIQTKMQIGTLITGWIPLRSWGTGELYQNGLHRNPFILYQNSEFSCYVYSVPCPVKRVTHFHAKLVLILVGFRRRLHAKLGIKSRSFSSSSILYAFSRIFIQSRFTIFQNLSNGEKWLVDYFAYDINALFYRYDRLLF